MTPITALGIFAASCASGLMLVAPALASPAVLAAPPIVPAAPPIVPMSAMTVQDAPAQPTEPGASDAVRGDEITPQSRQAVDRGLEWLATRQQADGGFGGGGTAFTAIAAIAFMSSGSLPNRGPYGENVARAVQYVIDNAQPSGLLCQQNAGGLMYHHGFATLLLGEVYGMTGDENVKEPLQRAVRLIQKSQHPLGGWRYQPAPTDHDISVTICQVMGLRAARDGGIKVEKAVIDKAVEYVQRCQNNDGGFSYRLGQGQHSQFARSAAGVATLYYAGINEGETIDNGLAYVNDFLPSNDMRRREPHYYYGHYYAAQAMFLAGGDSWEKWFPAIRDSLVAEQQNAGNWTGEQGDEYCTAMALIILQMPNRYLPVFSGKGAEA